MPPHDIFAGLRTSPDDAEPFLTRAKRVVVTQAAGHGKLIDEALGDTVWGEIRWDRSLGWPIAARMADGFVVEFKRLEPIEDARVGQGGVPIGTKGKWVEAAPPILWDGPHDEESFRVSFLFFGARWLPHAISVQLKTGIEWDGGNPWWVPPVRQIVWPSTLRGDGAFLMELEGPKFIDPFTVVNEFYKK